MTRQNVEKAMRSFNGEKIDVKLYNAVFGVFTETFEDYTYEINELALIINNEMIAIHEIMSIDLIVDDEKRIEMIKNATEYYTAFQIAKGHLGGSVIDALDEKSLEFKKTLKIQLKELKETIKSILKVRKSNLSVKEVMTHLLYNTRDYNKNGTALEKNTLKTIYSNINNTIDKLSSVEIF